MKEYSIRIPDVETAKQFCRLAGECDFDIDLVYNRVVIDAKSILGVFALGIGKEFELVFVNPREERDDVLNAVKNYRIAA